MAKKTDFIGEVVTQMMLANKTSALFKGHGLPAWVIKEIKARPDLAVKIANILSTLKAGRRGVIGLKKSNVFQIRAYKTFNELRGLSAEHIQEFIAKLPEKDQLAFSNDQIVVIALKPDREKVQWDAYMDAHVTVPVTGKSVMLSFDKVISNVKGGGGTQYLAFFIGDSAILPKDAKLAFTRDKKNGMLSARIAKTAKKRLSVESRELKAAKLEIKRLSRESRKLGVLAAGQQLYAQTQDVLGDSVRGDIMSGFFKRNGLRTKAARKGYEDARVAWNMGNKGKARRILKDEVYGEEFLTLLQGFKLDTASTRREAKIAAEIKTINTSLRELNALLVDETDPKVIGSLKRRITVLKTKKRNLNKNRANVATDMFVGSDYASMLAEVNAKLKVARARGMELSAAVKGAVKNLPVPQQVKQQIATQAIQQVVEQQMSAPLAVQQAIQTTLQQYPGQQQLSGDFSAADLLASIS